jgi:hypothetical protein
MVNAFEEAYEKRDEIPRDKLREFAMTYDKDIVAEQHMKPAVDELLERMSKR